MENKLISFIMFSRNLNVVKGFLDNIESTVKNPESVELLLKLDEDQVEAKRFIEEEAAKRPFSIKYIITPRLNGLVSLWLACNELFLLSSPDSYFVQSISDEVRFETIHWDEILKKYIGFFPDHVFRLRMSTFKLNTYPFPFICNLTPDSFPIYTRQWLTLTMGFGSCFWASDVYHQFVAYHLSLGEQGYRLASTPLYDQGISRDVPLLDLKFSGLEFGVGVSSEVQKNLDLWRIQGWNKNLSHCYQEDYSYLAKRLSSYIWAVKNNIKQFSIRQNKLKKTVQVVDESGVILYREVSYQLPRMAFYMANVLRKMKVSRVEWGWWCEMHFSSIREKILWRLNLALNTLLPRKKPLLLGLLVRLKLPRSMQSFFHQLMEINNQMTAQKRGRIQKNIALFFITFRAIIHSIFDGVERFMIGSPPGLKTNKKLFKIFSQPKWPKSFIKTSKKDMEWALETFKKQKENYQEMENSSQHT